LPLRKGILISGYLGFYYWAYCGNLVWNNG
jgi:hypothetical protein